jgi:phenylacetate-CoA ligase
MDARTDVAPLESAPAGSLAAWFTADAGPIEHWSADRLRGYHRDALAEQIAHVAAGCEFYRGKFAAAGVAPTDFRDLDDLARFPFTAKDELRGDPWILLAIPKDQVSLVHTSTGTTGGDWSYLLYSWDDMHTHDTVPAPRLLMPVRRGDVVVNALPYEMSSSGQSFQRSLQGGFGAVVVPVGKGGFYSDPDKTVRIIRDLQADVLVTTPPYAMLLAEAAAGRGFTIGADIAPRFLWITGEGCSPAYRRRLEELWNCPALVFYGSMECSSIAIECPRKAGSHVSLGQVYVEIVDPKTGAPLPHGQVGEVVCTVLQRKASPLIRFRTQDLGFLDATPCECGVLFPRLHIRGRMVDQIAGGEAAPQVSPYLIEDVLYSQPEMGHNYQIYTDGPRLLVEGELRPGCRDDAGQVRGRIEAALAQRKLTAEFRWVERIPRTGGKTRRVRPLADRDQVMRQSA